MLNNRPATTIQRIEDTRHTASPKRESEMWFRRLRNTIRRVRVEPSLQRFFLAVALVFLFSAAASAQGGPPFRTDDPETPGNRQWEINLGFIGEREVRDGSYATPNIDINYGLGDRIQLKFELPLNIQEWRGDPSYVAAGLGNSLIGVKWRFYQHGEPGKVPPGKISFAMSTYPQLILNNPTRSVTRGIADYGPQFLLPVEANAKFGPIQIVGEVGYWFTNKHHANSHPDSWTRGLIVGHEFRSKTELYLELHDEEEVAGVERQSTIGIGGRQPLTKNETVLLLGMVGRSLRAATPTNGQPNWIAYFGLQFLFGPDKKP
jgi:hypothetical protein